MDYEKAYKDALSRAKDCHVNKKFSELDDNAQQLCEYIFPELIESEDEKIRKAIYNCVKWFGFDSHYFKNVSQEECLAWLEKQGEPQPYKGNSDTMRKNLIKAFKSVGGKHWGGFDVRDIIHFLESKDAIELEKQSEQKHVDKIESKFKVGDWVVYDMSDGRVTSPFQIISMTNKSYEFDDGRCFYFSDAEDTFRKWTIEDAKDGDVLVADDDKPFIFKGLLDPNHPNYPTAHCGFDSEDYLIISNRNVWWTDECVKPATKEQRDTLFAKMREEGYEWDAEKKELKEIEKIDEKHKVGKYFTGLIPCWVNAPSTQQPAHNYHGKNIIAIHLKDGGYRCCCIDNEKPVTFTLPENTQLVEGWKRKSAEWNDEDEKIIETMCKEGDLRPSQMIWLKSIKDRVQPHWKPTEEQLNALYQTSKNKYVMYNATLTLLYNDLKKL